ncbi:MAG: hypothetical protein B7Y99_11695 [Caulobacterales bacterium 32-69-10]|nr:MAG: hypothetical protein B7Y99_11695 [Caulobacterales bacterium 32-69-10]
MMKRTLTALAVLASSAALAGTASAEDVKVNLVGLSPAAAYAKIEMAAKAVCMPETFRIYSVYLSSACVAETVEATLAKISSPALTKYVEARKSFLVASN